MGTKLRLRPLCAFGLQPTLPCGTMSTSQAPAIVIACALEFERDRLERASLGNAFEIFCCGPGAKGIGRLVEERAGDARPIVLAGLAGGLVDQVHVGAAYLVREIRAATGESLRPTLQLPDANAKSVSASCPPRTLTTPGAKRAWHAKHRTELVDLESEAFARAMQRSARPWAIVRGVSDGVDDALPDSIDSWVDEHGRTRRGFIALAMLRHPTLVTVAQRLGTHAREAMDAVAEVLRRGANST